MPAGQYLATGFMYLNLGCHMMFVLKNRLKANGIPQDKTVKIIEDLVQAIFKGPLVREVLTPHEPIAVVTLRELFRKLAHSSIMKLDTASMERLLSLILMTIKKEFFLSSSPLELYSITKANLVTLQNYVGGTNAEATLQAAVEEFITLGEGMSFLEYYQVREYVLSVMEPYQSRVVIFAETGLQTERGKLIFLQRNSHNQHPLLSTLPAYSNNATYLPLTQWKQWNSSLAVHQSRKQQRQSEPRLTRSEVDKEKSLNDLFGVGAEAVDFDVKLELFSYGETKQTKPAVTAKPEVTAKPQEKGASSRIRQLIEGEFKGVGEENEQEVDLLEVMDNS